jgi:hypothetical protein
MHLLLDKIPNNTDHMKFAKENIYHTDFQAAADGLRFSSYFSIMIIYSTLPTINLQQHFSIT